MTFSTVSTLEPVKKALKKPKVLVTDQIHESAIDILADVCEVLYEPKLNAEDLHEKLKDCQGLMIRSASKVTAETFKASPGLQIVGRAGVGVDNVDLKAANQQGCIVVNSPEGNTVAAAEHTLGLLFALARHIPQGDASLKAGRWDRKSLTGIELQGKTLGLVGMGKIGARVAKACAGLGMTVLVYDPFIAPSVVETLPVRLVELAEIYAQSDFITLHVPKTKDTLNLINETTLKLCKPGVRLINCARGGLIDEAALAKAIESGYVAGAALDVFSQEPLEESTPLRTLGGKVILTPHLGASTEEAQLNVALDVARQLREYFLTGSAQSAVNSPLLRPDILDPVKHYLPLADILGQFAGQLLDPTSNRSVVAVEITAKGELANLNTAPLTLAVLKGLFSLTREGVNLVNALPIAQERGVQIQESKSKGAGSYLNQLSVSLQSASQTVTVAGTLLAAGNFRLTQINHFEASVDAQGTILVAPHADRPGMVAKIAAILGDASINIRSLQVGRQTNGPGNVMIFNLDQPLAPAQLEQMAALQGVDWARQIRLETL